MEFLGDHYELGLPEDSLGSENGIECAEACVVANDVLAGDAFLNESIFHLLRFVICLGGIVAANDQRADSFRMVELSGSGDSVFEKRVFLAVR